MDYVAGILGFLLVGTISFSGYVVARRSSSGRVGTSEADVLWREAQDMRRVLIADKSKVEDQRDRLIDQQSEMLPVIADFKTSIDRLGELLGQVLERVSAYPIPVISASSEQLEPGAHEPRARS